jgi:hypothetical protein
VPQAETIEVHMGAIGGKVETFGGFTIEELKRGGNAAHLLALPHLVEAVEYFRASYKRKLDEHSATLADAMQLCKERDEARAKLAAAEAHCATLRAALEEALLDYDGYTTRVDGAWECSSCGALAGFGETPERLGKAHREGCGGGGAIEAALAATPADSLDGLPDARRAGGHRGLRRPHRLAV